jgi:hypothetical protein
MVDIEPMLTYDYSNFGIKNVYSLIILFYIAFINPIFAILNYDIKTNKQVIQDIVKKCMKVVKCYIHNVSKRDLINDKNIIYMTNHVSVGDYFIDNHILHHNTRFVSSDKLKILLPILSLTCDLTSSSIYVSSGNSKEKVLENFKLIEKLRKSDNTRNVALYPEGLRRPHRHTVSNSIKKGFIYHSFENNLPIQIIHTTNKDYVMDDEKIMLRKNTNLFTYYGRKIDPQKLKVKFEKKHKRVYTKDDYYNYVYKQWSKIWSKMDKYRIDTLRSQGLSYDECIEKMDNYSTKFPIIEDKIVNGDKPLSVSFLLLRTILWSIVYFIIFKIIEKCFSLISCIYKQEGSITPATNYINKCSFRELKFPFLANLPFSLNSVSSLTSTAQ